MGTEIYINVAKPRRIESGFHSFSCLQSTVKSHFNKDPTIAPALPRLHLHDCFIQVVNGYGLVLIARPSAERDVLPNMGLRGFEMIEDAKTQLKALCPSVVSLADILALAARDAVDMSNGPRWPVSTGRRDGRVSSSSQTSINLYSPRDSVAVQRQNFAAKGLDNTLVGAHTIVLYTSQ